MPKIPTAHIDRLPEDSRFKEYVDKVPVDLKSDPCAVFEKIYLDCLNFLKDSKKISFIPVIVKLVDTHEEYIALEQKYSKQAISKEVAKVPSRAFSVHNKFRALIYVDVMVLIELLKYGYPTFILDIVRTYIHELLHIAYPDRLEQEIFNLECILVEEFLEFKMPEEFKKLRVTDYYSSL